MYTIYLYMYIYIFVSLNVYFLSDGPVLCILMSISNPVDCILLSDMGVCCVTVQWLVLPHLWTCTHGEHLFQSTCPRGIIGVHTHSFLLHPKNTDLCLSCEGEGMSSKGLAGEEAGNGSWCAARCLFLEGAGTCRDGLF